MKNEQSFFIDLINYYKRTLEVTELIKHKFKKEYFIQSNSDLKDNLEYLIFGIKDEYTFELAKEYCFMLLDKLNSSKKNKKEFQDEFTLYYSPAMLQINDFYINPFFIKVQSLDNISKIIENYENNNFDENIFNGEELIFNPLLILEPFELVDHDLTSKLLNELERENRGLRIDNFEQMKDILIKAINTWLDENLPLEKCDFERLNKGLVYSFEKLYKEQQISKEKDDIVEKKIKLMFNPHIIVKVESNQDDKSNINGLLKTYESFEQNIKDNSFNDSNLLYYFLSGSEEKYSPVSLDIKDRDLKKELLLDYDKIIELSRSHLGALTEEHDLTISQKYCLNACKSHLNVIPVNGPPGTGKTSLLRAIIGDIIVSNAIRTYSDFLKTGDINFSTPIISFSTNNKALENIASGINEVLEKIKGRGDIDDTSKVLYKRWINAPISYYEDNKFKTITINEANIYSPLFKSWGNVNIDNPKETVISWDNLSSIIDAVASDNINIISKFLENFNILDLGFKIPKENILEFRKQSLELALEYLFLELNTIQSQIEEKADNFFINNNYKIFKALLSQIQRFQNSEDFIIQNRIQFDSYCNHLNTKINLFFKKYNSIQNKIDSLHEDSERAIKKIKEDSDNSISEDCKYLEEQIDNLSNEFTKKVGIFSTSLEEGLNKLKEKRDKETDKILKRFDSFIPKIKNIFTKEKDKQLEDVSQNYDSQVKKIMEDIEVKIDNESKVYKVKSKRLMDEKNIITNTIIEQSEKSSETIRNDFIKKIQDYENKYDEATVLFQLHNLNHKEAYKKIIAFKKLVESFSNIDIEFYDEFSLRLEKDFVGSDFNLRTKAMFYSLHILEGLLLYDVIRELEIVKENKVNRCFNHKCGKRDLKRANRNDDKIEYYCSSCGSTFINNTVKKIGRPLTQSEVVTIITFKNVTIDNTTFMLRVNEDNPKYWNVAQGSKTISSDKLSILKRCSVLFPLLNTTCHSFGTMFAINDDNTVPESLIEHLFVDEAGMILSPYMINLLAGKKVFLFGDEKQIEPVYPFSENKRIYDYLINRYFDNNEDKQRVLDYYAINTSNAMKIANKAVSIKNPMNKIDLDGDLWLLEHFRCKESIIKYCNENYYNNYMIPRIKDEENQIHLDSINHEFTAKRDGKSRYNRDEAQLIINDIEEKLEKDICIDTQLKNIGIITPYSKQENILYDLLKSKGWNNKITFGTVHKFQGSEKETIYFSTTVGINNTSTSDTYMINKAQPNVINVAVSRSKSKLIVVGNIKNLQLENGSLTTKLIEHINEYKEEINFS
ncbi:AAA domain-containing protein [Arcobacter sp. F2176]|uniref:AAA domain-containing protein n=1 Tax=Arcobacter sp. F2176 TaxID=2044511 RepID=UPI0013E94AC8|nr:AAA domain-containing protein [Arcobacter sp. F2176]